MSERRLTESEWLELEAERARVLDEFRIPPKAERKLVCIDEAAYERLTADLAAAQADNERLRARIAAADALADGSRQLADEVVACYAGYSDWGKLQQAWDVWEDADAAYRATAASGESEAP